MEFSDLAEKKYDKIMSQREEILSAFIAKYGIEPENVVQVLQYTNEGIQFWVERKILGQYRNNTNLEI